MLAAAKAFPESLRSLEKAVHAPEDPSARTDMALASLYSGMALANAGLGRCMQLPGLWAACILQLLMALYVRVLLPHSLERLHAAVRNLQPTPTCLFQLEALAEMILGDPKASITEALSWLHAWVASFALPSLRHYGLSQQEWPLLAEKATGFQRHEGPSGGHDPAGSVRPGAACLLRGTARQKGSSGGAIRHRRARKGWVRLLPCTAKDLSAHHHMIGSCLPQTKQSNGLNTRFPRNNSTTTENRVFVSGVPLLSDAQVDLLREELDTFFEPDHAGREWWYEYHSNEASEPSRFSSRPGQLAPCLSGLSRCPVESCLYLARHPTPGRRGPFLAQPTVLQADSPWWCGGCNIRIILTGHAPVPQHTSRAGSGLDDTDESNGCMFYVPGSHQWDLLYMGLAGDMDAIEQVLSTDQWEALQSPVPVCLKKGHAAFPSPAHGA